MNPEAFVSVQAGSLVSALDARGTRGPAFVPARLPPVLSDGDRRLRLALSRADQQLARLDGIARQVERPEELFVNYLRREAVLSSAIEGTHTSLADLMLFEATNRARNDDDLHVSNYVNAFIYGRDRVKDIPVGRRLFAELHSILMADTDHSKTTPGVERNCLVFVGKPTFRASRYVPPPAEFVTDLLENLEHYLLSYDEAALVKLAIAHYQFEAIHPFRDGNGRIGRLLISLWLHREGILTSPMLYLSVYFEKFRRRYYDALLKVSTEGAWLEWVLFFLEGVATQARDASNRTEALVNLRKDYKDRLTGPRAAQGPHRLVDELFRRGVISVPGARDVLGVTYAAAKASVQKLLDAGILDPAFITANNTRYYPASDLLHRLEQPMGDGERASE